MWTGILGTGMAFDAQKQFVANVEGAISSPVDLTSVIKCYQDVLTYSQTKVNYVFGVGLYMSPSDMLLRLGQVAGYNNPIIIITSDQALGLNMGFNTSDASPDVTNDTRETGLVKAQKSQLAPTTADSQPQEKANADQHENEKPALIMGGIAIRLVGLWVFMK